jgi:hypothetical protein
VLKNRVAVNKISPDCPHVSSPRQRSPRPGKCEKRCARPKRETLEQWVEGRRDIPDRGSAAGACKPDAWKQRVGTFGEPDLLTLGRQRGVDVVRVVPRVPPSLAQLSRQTGVQVMLIVTSTAGF